MTEITENSIKLSPAIRRFILHWGDMGGQWGVNRSVAQIHALLLVSDRVSAMHRSRSTALAHIQVLNLIPINQYVNHSAICPAEMAELVSS